ncbi:MAG: Flp pilus assembly complex ATPase component TadA, partial [Gammaproteobacteria bacterium]|nr:Flp pilus assembly complex ATPase component TadA [Gammaproteobacteria bacterium]
MSIKALERHLMPLMPFIEAKGVTEICVNQPQEVYVEQQSKFTCHAVEELDYAFLLSFASLVAEFNYKDFSTPLLSGSLPNGERIQFVMPPACEKGKLICSIRKHQQRDMSLEDYVANGAFANVITQNKEMRSDNLITHYQNNNILYFIQSAVQNKKNILISGGTGTG